MPNCVQGRLRTGCCQGFQINSLSQSLDPIDTTIGILFLHVLTSSKTTVQVILKDASVPAWFLLRVSMIQWWYRDRRFLFSEGAGCHHPAVGWYGRVKLLNDLTCFPGAHDAT